MNATDLTPQQGGCTCRAVRYRLLQKPLFIHACHCSWCQRETGATFAINALIEADQVELLSGEIDVIDTPSASGQGQQIVRCKVCKAAVWSHYSAAKEKIKFIRVGTLDHPDMFAPDIHIFTSTKLPWLQLPEDTPQVEEYYRRSLYWPEDSVIRYKKAIQNNNQ